MSKRVVLEVGVSALPTCELPRLRARLLCEKDVTLDIESTVAVNTGEWIGSGSEEN